MATIHATHNTSAEYAGNARLDVDTTTDGGVTLTLDGLQDDVAEAIADLTVQEALALALALTEAAGEAKDYQDTEEGR